MKSELEYSADDVQFDYPKEPRVTLSDCRDIINIDIDRMGAGYRAIINGLEVELPEGIKTIEEARQAAVKIAIAEIAAAAKELIDENF
jgi:hypothetical protein